MQKRIAVGDNVWNFKLPYLGAPEVSCQNILKKISTCCEEQKYKKSGKSKFYGAQLSL